MKKIILTLVLLLILSMFVSAQNDFAYTRATFLNQNPDPAEQGSHVELRWKVQKFGNLEMKDIVYELDVDYPFSFDKKSDAIKQLGDWRGYSDASDYFTLYYKLRVDKDALEGDYKVILKMSSKERVVQSEEYVIRVDKKEKPSFVIGSILTSPRKLISDLDDAELDIDLENIGDGDANNVKFELELPDGFSSSYSYSDSVVLGTVEAGNKKTASFIIDIDKNLLGGEYEAKAKLMYKEENDDLNEYKFKIIPFMIQLGDAPRFEIEDVEVLSGDLSPGSNIDLKFMIKNVGGKKADSVSIRAFKQSSQPFEFEEKSDFIGTLEPGHLGEAILKVNVDKGASLKNYLVDLEIRSIDGSEVIISDKQFSLNINSISNKKGLPSWVMFLVLAIVFALIGYFIGKKK